MISFVVAGSSDNPELAELENLCSCIKTTHSNIKFKIISKHENDWPSYIKQICKIYGFYELQNPICFTPLGELIGSTNEFKNLLEQKFGVSSIKLDIPDRVSESINQQLTQEKYDWDHRLLALKEKVHDRFERLQLREKFKFDRELFEKMDLGQQCVSEKPAYFLGFKIQHNQVYVKYVEDYTPEIIIETNKPSQVDSLTPYEVPFDIVNALDRKKDQIDITAIQQKAANPLTENETQPEMKLKSKTVSKEGSRLGDQIDEPASSRDVDQVKMSSKRRRSKDSMGLADKVANSHAELSNIAGTQNDFLQQNFDPATPDEQSDARNILQRQIANEKFTSNCDSINAIHNQLEKIKPIGINLREWIVTKLENNYYLAINPESVFKEQCLLIRGDKLNWSQALAVPDKKIDAQLLVDQENAQGKSRSQTVGITNTSQKPMVHFDFSHVQKVRVTSKNVTKAHQEEQVAQGTKSNITSRFFDPQYPFSLQDLETVEGLVKELDAVATFSVLPTQEQLARSQARIQQDLDYIQNKKRIADKVLNYEKFEHLSNKNPNLQPFQEDIKIPTLPYLSYNIHILQRSVLLEDTDNQDELLDFERLIGNPHNLVNDLEQEKARVFNLELEKEKLLMIQKQKEREEFLKECKLKRELEQKEQEESKMGDGKKQVKTQEKINNDVPKVESVDAGQGETNSIGEIPIQKTEAQQGDGENEEETANNHDNGEDEIMIKRQDETDHKEYSEENFDQQYLGKLYKIKSWKTLHKLYIRTGNETVSEIANVISNMVRSIEYDQHHYPEIDFDPQHSGFTYILSPKFILLVIQNEPYYKYQDNHMFLQPWSYLGFFTFPTFKKTWPQTDSIDEKSKMPLSFENPLKFL